MIEYEGRRELKQLALNCRLLRDELARPKTGSAPLLLATKLAVEKYPHLDSHIQKTLASSLTEITWTLLPPEQSTVIDIFFSFVINYQVIYFLFYY